MLLLSGALAGLLTSVTGVLRVDTGRSFSLWPGVVELRQLRLEVMDSNVHLWLELPHGRVDVLLRELLRRRFCVEDLSGEHFVVRLRPRFAELSDRRRAALPPLSEPVAKPSRGASGPPWPIRIARSDARYDELWISELRYRGEARISGGFELLPLHRLSIEPSAVVASEGSSSYGPEQRALALERVQLRARLEQTGIERLAREWREKLSVRVELAGQVVDLAFAGNLWPELQGLSGGAGELRSRAAAERGRWLDDFDLTYSSPRIAYAREAWRGETAWTLRARAGGAGDLLLSARLERLHAEAREQPVAALEQLEARAALSPAFPLGLPRSLRLELEELALDQLQELPAALRPGGWQPRSVQLQRARAELAWQEGTLSASAQAHFRDASFAIGAWSLRQSGQIGLQGVRWNGPGSDLLIAAASLDLDPVQIRYPGIQIDSWRMELASQNVRFAAAAGRWRADFTAAADDAEPVWRSLVSMGCHRAPRTFSPCPASRCAAPWISRLIARSSRSSRAVSETVDVAGRLLRRGEQTRAAFLFKAAPFSLGVQVQPDETRARPFAGEGWLEQRLRELERSEAAPAP